MKTQNRWQVDGFIVGFMKGSGIQQKGEAEEQWAWYSRQLSNSQIRYIETGGYKSGLREGKAFKAMYEPKEPSSR